MARHAELVHAKKLVAALEHMVAEQANEYEQQVLASAAETQ
jgi:hypothetical protein